METDQTGKTGCTALPAEAEGPGPGNARTGGTMKKMVWVIVLLLAGGCATLQGIVRKPEVRFAGVSLDHMSLFEATPVFNFKMTNPNPVRIAVERVSYSMKINDRKFVNGVVNKGSRIGSNDSEIVSVPVTIDYLDLFETLTELNRSELIRYELSGDFDVGPFRIPFGHEGSLMAPRLPKISLENVLVSDISLTRADVRLVLGIENNNPFAVKLNGLEYGIKLGGETFARGEMEAVPAVDENGVATVSIPLTINLFKLGRSVYALLKEASSGYELTGEMRFEIPELGEKRVPFSRRGNVPVSK
jgi:LEA14-like dessication related protein